MDLVRAIQVILVNATMNGESKRRQGSQLLRLIRSLGIANVQTHHSLYDEESLEQHQQTHRHVLGIELPNSVSALVRPQTPLSSVNGDNTIVKVLEKHLQQHYDMRHRPSYVQSILSKSLQLTVSTPLQLYDNKDRKHVIRKIQRTKTLQGIELSKQRFSTIELQRYLRTSSDIIKCISIVCDHVILDEKLLQHIHQRLQTLQIKLLFDNSNTTSHSHVNTSNHSTIDGMRVRGIGEDNDDDDSGIDDNDLLLLHTLEEQVKNDIDMEVSDVKLFTTLLTTCMHVFVPYNEDCYEVLRPQCHDIPSYHYITGKALHRLLTDDERVEIDEYYKVWLLSNVIGKYSINSFIQWLIELLTIIRDHYVMFRFASLRYTLEGDHSDSIDKERIHVEVEGIDNIDGERDGTIDNDDVIDERQAFIQIHRSLSSSLSPSQSYSKHSHTLSPTSTTSSRSNHHRRRSSSKSSRLVQNPIVLDLIPEVNDDNVDEYDMNDDEHISATVYANKRRFSNNKQEDNDYLL